MKNVFGNMKIAILANGEFPETGPARDALDAADAVVCCDGAAARLLASGREPELAVGDGDSLPSGVIARLGRRFLRARSQKTNDLAKAFRAAFSRGARDIAILGAGGGREDHLLANVFLLAGFAELDPGVCMITASGRFDAVCGRRRFGSPGGATVSVFAPFPGTVVSSRGLKWPLGRADLAMLHAGLSNRVTGRDGFEVKASRPVLVYRPFRA